MIPLRLLNPRQNTQRGGRRWETGGQWISNVTKRFVIPDRGAAALSNGDRLPFLLLLPHQGSDTYFLAGWDCVPQVDNIDNIALPLGWRRETTASEPVQRMWREIKTRRD